MKRSGVFVCYQHQEQRTKPTAQSVKQKTAVLKALRKMACAISPAMGAWVSV